LLTQDQRQQLEVVLVRPRNPLNIGAAARAMANFGLNNLTVVAPWEPVWREAKSAVGAPEILANARLTQTLAEAVAHSTLVLGTGTSTTRKAEQPVLSLPDLPPYIDGQLTQQGRIAIVFGPEKHGLTREDLALCHAMIEVPTDSVQPSMNLGQAVAVCLYEAVIHCGISDISSLPHSTPATAERLDLLTSLIDEVMEAARYSPASMRQSNLHDLRLMLRRFAPNEPDTRRLLGLFRRILWRLNNLTKTS